MSVKAKLTAGAATFVMVGGGLGMAGTLTASAATPSCGSHCISLYTQKFGTHYFVDVYQQRAAAGRRASSSRARTATRHWTSPTPMKAR